jgi:hypothetical protein
MKTEPGDNHLLNIWYPATFVKTFYTILSIIGVIWLINYLIPNNYCFEQNRRLTDKEYISIVLSSLLNSRTGLMKTHSWDNTVESYLAHHPNCCTVSMNSSLFDGYPTVDITYEMSDEFKKQINALEKHTHYESLTAMTACGEQLEEAGEATTPPNKLLTTNH